MKLGHVCKGKLGGGPRVQYNVAAILAQHQTQTPRVAVACGPQPQPALDLFAHAALQSKHPAAMPTDMFYAPPERLDDLDSTASTEPVSRLASPTQETALLTPRPAVEAEELVLPAMPVRL